MATWQFETPHDVLLRVTNTSGSVEIEAGPRSTTEVEVSAFDSSGEDLVGMARVEERDGGGRHEIVVDLPTAPSGGGWSLRRVFGDRPAVRVVVRLPEGSSVDATMASADLRTRGVLGALTAQSASGGISAAGVQGMTARTASGDIRVEEVAGDLRIQTASGDVVAGLLLGGASISTASGTVSVERAEGDLVVGTTSGDVRVGGALGNCRVTSTSGDQQLGRLVAGAVELDSVSGELQIGVAHGTAVHVDLHSVSGTLSSDIELDESGHRTDSGPNLDLRARSVSGDVSVHRAAE